MKTITITCDCCNTQLQENEVYNLEHYIHVSPSFNRFNGHGKVIDGRMHSISGRTEKKDFCLPCYNMLFDNFFQSIEKYQKSINAQ